MSVWDNSNQAFKLAIPVIMQKRQMEEDRRRYEQGMAAMQAAKEQEFEQRKLDLLMKAREAQMNYAKEGMMKAYEKGDRQGVQAFGQHLHAENMPVFGNEVPGPSLPGQPPPLEYFAAPQKQGMTEAELTERALGGDQMSQQILDAMANRKLETAKAGKTDVSVDARSSMGSIPPGFMVEYNDQGQPERMKPIPGGPAELDIQKEEHKRKTGAEVKAQAAQTVYEDTDRALDVLNKWGHLASGVAGTTDWLPSAPAHQLNQHIESIKGNVGIDSLIKIKESGAGLGQIPQTQLEMLASLLGRLNTRMRPEDLRFNIQRIQEIYADIVEKEGGDPKEAYKERLKRIGDRQQKDTPDIDKRVEELINKYGK
jgi:hypothetical protein